jgi:tetratricopeptide (TPR) repeat protein
LSLGCLLAACAGTGGDALLRSGDYPGAIAVYEEAERAAPDDGEIKRNLGVAYLRASEIQRAIAKLEEARAIRPDDARVHFFLAQAREADGDFEGALRAYGAYLEQGGANEAALQARIRALARRRAERDIRAALQTEAERATPGDSTTLAIPDFANISGSRELAPLATGLAAVVITDLRQVEEFRIVERERWHVLRNELLLAREGEAADTLTSGTAEPAAPRTDPGSPETAEFETDPGDLPTAFEEDESGLIDPRIAPVVGRVLGAGTLVQGLFTVFGETDVQLDAAIVRLPGTETTIAGEPVVGTVRDVLRLEKRLVFQILAELGVEPTAEERAAIDNLLVNEPASFLDFCLALQLDDEERYEEAARHFQSLVLREPAFAAAMGLESKLYKTERDFSRLAIDELEELVRTDPRGPRTFLDDLAVSVGNGPGPDDGDGAGPESDDATDLTVTDVEKVETDLQTIPDFPPPPGGAR